MSKIKSLKYFNTSVIYQTNCFDSLPKIINENYRIDQIFLITDNNLYKLYNQKLVDAFKTKKIKIIYFDCGEKSKSIATYQEIIKKLLQFEINKNSLIIAFGGGVVLDLVGFIAGTLFRGVELLYIPTSLLAMADSSIGGKTGIDFLGYKNLIGSFMNPKLVLIDISLLKTLPKEEYQNGFFEVIKMALLKSKKLLLKLQNTEITEDIIREINIIKLSFIKKDYYDHGIRKYLNFGHTFGHAIETVSNLQIKHGFAVAYGILIVLDLGIKKGITPSFLKAKIEKMFLDNGLDININYAIKDLLEPLSKDKKRSNGELELIVLSDIGKPMIKRFNDIYES